MSEIVDSDCGDWSDWQETDVKFNTTGQLFKVEVTMRRVRDVTYRMEGERHTRIGSQEESVVGRGETEEEAREDALNLTEQVESRA